MVEFGIKYYETHQQGANPLHEKRIKARVDTAFVSLSVAGSDVLVRELSAGRQTLRGHAFTGVYSFTLFDPAQDDGKTPVWNEVITSACDKYYRRCDVCRELCLLKEDEAASTLASGTSTRPSIAS